MDHSNRNVLVVGAGLAGCEAAWYLGNIGYQVVLTECKVQSPNPAQKLKTFAELVCTNSLKSADMNSAHGLLKNEMELLGSLIISCAHECRVPAGDALAVNRDDFSNLVTKKVKEHQNISVVEREIVDPCEAAKEFNCAHIIIASGPLTTDGLSDWIIDQIAQKSFYFYDAIAPVIESDSLEMTKIYAKDRYKEKKVGEEPDYLNIPLNKVEYESFMEELVKGKKTPAHNFEEYKFFESCLPIDVMAERGVDTARFSCMKPVGLEMVDGLRPYAVIQLRKENLLGSAYNMVGFQTRLTYGEQKRIFRTLPGMGKASFAHLGSVHRNSYIESRHLLNKDFSSKKFPHIFFAGQISGVEGYTESASMGLFVAYQLHRKLRGLKPISFPVESGIGALVNYVMTVPKAKPSNINFGLLPSVALTREQRKSRERKKLKKQLVAQRAREVFQEFMESVREDLCCQKN